MTSESAVVGQRGRLLHGETVSELARELLDLLDAPGPD
jgi:hypothetical protein